MKTIDKMQRLSMSSEIIIKSYGFHFMQEKKVGVDACANVLDV